MRFHGKAWAAGGGRPGPGEAAEFSAWTGETHGRRIRGSFAKAAIGLAIAAVIAFAVAQGLARHEPIIMLLCGCGHSSATPATGA